MSFVTSTKTPDSPIIWLVSSHAVRSKFQPMIISFNVGEPGKSVQGGWTFTNGDDTYELVYTADEGGFQPEAAYIPIPVQDTNEVTEAKEQFYSLYEEAKAQVQEAIEAANENEEESVVDVRRKREAHGSFYNRRFYGGGHPRPYFGQHEAPLEQPTEDQVYKYTPYEGFVPVDGTVMEEVDEEKPEDVQYKYIPYRGYVPVEVADAIEKEQDEYAEAVQKRQEEYAEAVEMRQAKYAEAMEKQRAEDKKQRAVYYEAMEKQREEAKLQRAEYFEAVEAKREEAKQKRVEYFEAVEKKREEDINRVYKYVPLRGFVPAEAVEADEEADNKEFKFVPYRGFVPLNKDGELEEEEDDEMVEGKTYTYHPYLGYVPQDEDSKDDAPLFKYLPYRGFVKVNKDGEEEKPEYKSYFEMEQDTPYGHHDYHNKDKTYMYDPFRGFYPTMADKKMEEAEVDLRSDAVERKKRHTDDSHDTEDEAVEPKKAEALIMPYPVHHQVVPYAHHPMYAQQQMYAHHPMYAQQQMYAQHPMYTHFPGLPQPQKKVETETEETQAAEVTYSYDPFYGFVEIKKDEAEEGDVEEDKPQAVQEYKFVPYYGFVPVQKEGEEEAEVSEAAEAPAAHHVQYVFHPFYGYMPVETKKAEEEEEKEEVLYKLDPYFGFVPVEAKQEEMKDEEVAAARKKREAVNVVMSAPNFPQAQYQYQPHQYYQQHQYLPYSHVYPYSQVYPYVQVVNPITQQQQQNVESTKEATDEQVINDGNDVQAAQVPLQILPGVVHPFPVLGSPFITNPLIVGLQPALVTNPTLPLPESEFPVFSYEPNQDEQGAVDF